MPEVGKPGYTGDIQVPIPVEVPGHGPVTTIDRIKILLGKMLMSIIPENVNSVIGLQHRREIAIVAATVEYIRMTVLVEIIQFEISRPITGGKTQ